MTLAPSRSLLVLAAFFGLIAVVLGALGAHGAVHDTLAAAGKLESWETGVRYQLPHSMFLYVLALFLGQAGRSAKLGWVCVFVGTLVFSGSIYLLAYMGWKFLGPVTPLGGLVLMVGWVVLAFASWKKAA
ncbi:MAG: DUF423 domain-containing protein [Verrucomicrobiota bacterium]